MTAPKAKLVEIMLIEDNPGDVTLTRNSLRSARVLNNLTVASDGEKAMDLLRGRAGQALRPDLILLDISLPRMNGHEVLHELKTDPALASIPVIILTSSQAEQDIARSYALHANSYVTKPVLWTDFQKVIAAVEDFWLTIVKLPPVTA